MNQSLQYEFVAVMPAALATGTFVSLCSIESPDGNLGPSGAPSGNFLPVAGLQNIPCKAQPPSEARIQATEMKALAEIMAQAPMHVLLNAWYPQIENGVAAGWRCIIDGIVLDILGAESDSQGQMTRMQVRVAQV